MRSVRASLIGIAILVLGACGLELGMNRPTEPCASDEDCDDGVFCNGEERCVANACRDGSPPYCEDADPCTIDNCDEEAAGCTHEPMDEDGDLFVSEDCGGRDCDDANADIHPNAIDSTCDAVDDDCDGTADDEYVPTDCGIGVCQSESTCIDGDETCTPGTPISSDDSTCDNLDDNCNGATDEDYEPYICGEGECAVLSICAVGVESCTPGTPSGEDSDCDSVDEDCDGTADEHYVPYTCGVGACVSESTCSDGTEICDPGDPLSPLDTTCDGNDDDCDGTADEDYMPSVCGIGECQVEATCEYGTERCIPLPPPYTYDAVCDGRDEDCDGSVDDDYETYTCGTGACEATSICVDGLENCVPGDPLDAVDTTCDGVDDDCDGTADEEWVVWTCGSGACETEATCVDGVEECDPSTGVPDTDCDGVDDDCDTVADDDYITYSCGIGVCERSSKCTGGVESCSEGSPTGADESCDGIDQDCDGEADEHWIAWTCGTGLCETEATCVGGVEECIPLTGDPDTNCDGVDDDCDTVVDDDYITTTCGMGVCMRDSVCTSGSESCTEGPPSGISETICNGDDDDCDGSTDEDWVVWTCGSGECVTDATCVDGVEECVAGTGDPDTDCDGVDDDCDTVPDDEWVAYTCGLGVCEATATCISGTESCTEGSPTGTDDTCNGVDEDCDGTADEEWSGSCGVGECLRSGTCVDGILDCTPGIPTAETCNSLDDDCDGTVDDGTAITLCGTIPHATPQCVSGTCTIASCESGYYDVDSTYSTGCECGEDSYETAGLGGDTCATAVDLGSLPDNPGSNVDVVGTIVPAGDEDWYLITATDDVDTTADEFNFEVYFSMNPGGLAFDVYRGACSDAEPCLQETDCYNWYTDFSLGCDGEAPCGATAGTPGYNDCGNDSEDFLVRVYRTGGTTECASYTLRISNNPATPGPGCLHEDTMEAPYLCGFGECRRAADCGSGSVTCTPGTPTGTDDTCNDIDEDCDGTADEHFAANCGLGVCLRAASCVSGVESCTPGSPTGTDENCNGLDEDCDGTRDDGYLPTYTCGTGVCENDSECIGGTESCTPLPGEPDFDCDGIDDDCDTVVDEDYTATYTCGLGVCQRDSICTDGTESCAPGSPSGTSETICNGVDDDCDGSTDEDWVSTATCGIGACERANLCTGGTISCTPGDPVPIICYDDIDQDCDGELEGAHVATADTVIASVVYTGLKHPEIVATGSEFGVVYYNGGAAAQGVYFSRISPEGVVMTSATPVSDGGFTSGTSVRADIEWSGTEFGITWNDSRTGDDEIYFTRMSPEGIKVISDVRLTFDPNTSTNAVLVWNGSLYGVVWQDDRDDVDSDIYFTTVSGDGAPSGSVNRVTSSTGVSVFPVIDWNGTEYGLSWMDGRDGNSEVYFAMLDAAGNKVGSDFRVTIDAAQSQYPAIEWTGSIFGLTWTDERDGNPEIYFARMSALGAKETSDIRMTNDSWSSLEPVLTWAGGVFGLAWYDDRYGDFTVFFILHEFDGTIWEPEVEVPTDTGYSSLLPDTSYYERVGTTGGSIGIVYERAGTNDVWFNSVEGCIE